jgi:hypothetical protein
VSQLLDPNYNRASILPLGRHKQTGKLSLAVPGIAADLLSALMLPGDVYQGNVLMNDPATGHTSDEVIRRSADLAGAMTLGAGAIPADDSLRAGFKYATRYRPAGTATLPPGFKNIEPPRDKFKFGIAEYDKPLSASDIDKFELKPIDPRHPSNLKKSFEKFQDSFVNEFSEAGEKYKSRNGDFLVTPNFEGDGWQVTTFTDKTPTGHEVFEDFDELARFVWSREAYPKPDDAVDLD